MNRRFIISILCTCLLAPAFALGAPGDPIFVELKESKVRLEPKFWAKGIATVSFGDELIEQGRVDDWVHVTLPNGSTGYVHEGAVTFKRVILKGEPANFSAEDDAADIVLAGKGFNSDIEERYSQNDTGINYDAVNVIENWRVKAGDLRAFLLDGRLNVEGVQ